MSDERKYYCFCGDNCKFETMTKEQILAAILQAVETGTISNVNAGFITKVKEMHRGGYVTFWVGTQAEYNALESIEKNCIYIKTDDTSADELNALLSNLLTEYETLLTAVASKAPAGLVGTKDKAVEAWDDINTLIDEAVAKMENSTVEIISFYETINDSGGYITIHKGRNEDAMAVVDVKLEIDGMRLYRHAWSEGDTAYHWDEWEYENPPMIAGTEYRTTERYDGRPVYVKRLQKQLSGSAGISSIVLVSGVAAVVDCRAVLNHSNGCVFVCPAFDQDGTLAAHTQVELFETDAQITIKPVTLECANCTAEIVIKYTK